MKFLKGNFEICVESDVEDCLASWGLLVLLAGPNLSKSRDLINAMLKIPETLFVNEIEAIRALCFKSWTRLIDNFRLEADLDDSILTNCVK